MNLQEVQSILNIIKITLMFLNYYVIFIMFKMLLPPEGAVNASLARCRLSFMGAGLTLLMTVEKSSCTFS
jgi:hypothetical protein